MSARFWKRCFPTERHIMAKEPLVGVSNKIKCSHILVEKQSQALEILERIKNGDKFGKLARDLSLDPGSAKKDGNLGYFSKGMMVKPFEKVAYGLQIGEISEPVKTGFGYHIIKRLG